MQIEIFKYQATGNDFIILDNRKENFPAEDAVLIEKLCHRRFGIGADGLILVQNHQDFDFHMRYFNSDGHESTMCGNGGRCTVAFAASLGLFNGNNTTFMAVDGLHYAELSNNIVRLKMNDVHKIIETKNYFFIDTGSPHLVILTDNVDETNLIIEGRKWRYNKQISENGVNVNFIQIIDNETLKIRTYERGVEDETWSCGTGSVAAAIAFDIHTNRLENRGQIKLLAKGGDLTVNYEHNEIQYKNVYLTGKAEKVFQATIDI